MKTTQKLSLTFSLVSALLFSPSLFASKLDKEVSLQNKTVVELDTTKNSKSTTINLGYDNKNSQFLIEMLTKDGKLLTKNDFIKLDSGDLIRVNWFDTKLSKINEKSIDISEPKQVYTIDNLNFKEKKVNEPKCEAFYITYHLKGEATPLTKGIIFDKNGNSVSKLDLTSKNRCDFAKNINKDTIGYTKDGYVSGFSWNKGMLSTSKPSGFNTVIKKEGGDFKPDILNSYAVSTDFSHFYKMRLKPTKKSAHFGYDFEQYITHPSNYYFIVEFYIDGKQQQITAVQSVMN